VLRAVLLSAALVTVFGLFAYGAGAIIRHTAGAITAIPGMLFLFPLLGQALPTTWYNEIVRWLPGGTALGPVASSAPNAPALAPHLFSGWASSPCSAATRLSCSRPARGCSSAAMRDGIRDYPGSVKRAYPWLRRHRWVGDAALALVLVAGSASVVAGNPAVLPAVLALAVAAAARRRFPVPAYAAALAIAAAQVIVSIAPAHPASPLQPTFADAGILMLLYTVADRRPRRVSLPGLAACVALFGWAVAQWNPGPDRGQYLQQFALIAGLCYVLAPASAWALGDSLARRRAYLAVLEERAARAEAERDTRARAAAADERTRIARELHDVIAHNLSVMVAQADGGRYVFDTDPGKSRQAFAEIGTTGRQALSEMSHLLGVLHADPAESAFAPPPGVAEISRLVSQARVAGTRVAYTVEGAALSVTGGLSVAVYRIVQEALSNIRKHAGPGAAAEVKLRYGADELLVRVTDDGRGVPTGCPVRGHGLAGIRERAAMYGGTVRTGPRPDGGFEVAARLPLPGAPGAGGPLASGAAATDAA
jgi:signal transduction histidine kinase